ncbi:Src homology-3 domain protein [Kalmanozyma brasiliensis GHG001]|uniref:Scd2/ral3 protein n=1 Tax=Kalmanozyma brasiliensis (strain GHG001) TaxID=1365824 RepID=V5ECP9_KALBG|nr:Src homology-3 domain protein [Kalmanozyma brasiliensis GHG001]EST08216.1 Src homology-3 domain protein [Kalmanozyma brasiliensis GHG001]
MKGLKDFRRSLNKDRHSGGKPSASSASPGTFSNVKSAVTIQPPKLVIRAIRDYKSASPHELSFHKGDFFHVITDPAPNADWFEANNPMTNARGLVPASHFDVLSKSNRAASGTAAGPGASSPAIGSMSPPSGSVPLPTGASSSQAYGGRAAGAAMTAKGGGGLYAVVKYDFLAERADELEAKAGESIIVIAQSNFEWFVAKPIGRLGGPGLIPVAFVEIRDLVTGRPIEDVQELIESGVVPKVEEWKKMTAEYKKNTIPLGRFDFPQSSQPGVNSPYSNMAAAASGSSSNNVGVPSNGLHGQQSSISSMPAPTPVSKDDLYQQAQAPFGGVDPLQPFDNDAIDPLTSLPPGMSPGEPLPTGIITSATVDSFHYEQGDYWFRIQATHVAGPSASAPSNAPTAPDGEERDLILYRLYEDFYEFQIALLDHFPAEAGRETDANGHASERILPLMPGPLDVVDDLITSQRRVDLDQYIIELCSLPEYIMRSELVRLFFEPRPGDHCTSHPARGPTDARNSSLQYKDYGYLAGEADGGNQRSSQLGQPQQTQAELRSNGSNRYAEDQPVGRSSTSSRAEDELSAKMRNASLLSGSAGASSGQRDSTRSSAVFGGPGGAASTGRTSASSGHRKQNSSGPSSQPQATSGSSANVAYHRIKVARRNDLDSVIALRMPPSPTFAQLLEKVRERLGADVTAFNCNERPESIADDASLTAWLDEATDKGWKLMLHAS